MRLLKSSGREDFRSSPSRFAFQRYEVTANRHRIMICLRSNSNGSTQRASAGFGWLQSARGNQHVEMRKMVETPTESMLYDDYMQAHLIQVPGPLVEHRSSQGWQIVL